MEANHRSKWRPTQLRGYSKAQNGKLLTLDCQLHPTRMSQQAEANGLARVLASAIRLHFVTLADRQIFYDYVVDASYQNALEFDSGPDPSLGAIHRVWVSLNHLHPDQCFDYLNCQCQCLSIEVNAFSGRSSFVWGSRLRVLTVTPYCCAVATNSKCFPGLA